MFVNDAYDKKFIVKEIQSFMASKKRRDMITGDKYYEGKHDILLRKRTVIGQDGDLEEVTNLPNNRVVDNQYGNMVDQKANYLLGQPFTIQCDDDKYVTLLKKYLNKGFIRKLKTVGVNSLNCGVGYILVGYDENGDFSIRRLDPWEVIPFWKDSDHTVLEAFIRTYEVVAYEGDKEKTIQKVEVYDDAGIMYYTLEGGELIPECDEPIPYFTVGEDGFSWAKIPLIAFKYNSKEIPLINKVKSLQDGINAIESNFQNQMEEDPRNTILVLVNYDGENLGEFRRNLATYGAVKVRSIDGSGGDVRTLEVEVNAENYRTILQIFKKALIENARGYDAKDDRMNGNPNRMNIQSMYSDIDLDANGMETEYQAAFEELIWFINCHLYNSGQGDFEDEDLDIIFNRDMMMNETEIISNIKDSVGILSNETLIANHPYVDDPTAEMERIKAQEEDAMQQYGAAFEPAIEHNDGE